MLQLEIERLEDFRSGEASFPSVRLTKDTIIDLFPRKMWQGTVESGKGRMNLNHFCLAMTKKEWEELRERLNRAGVPIITGPVPRWGAHGNGISIYFQDPDGNTVEARYYEAGEANSPMLQGSLRWLVKAKG